MSSRLTQPLAALVLALALGGCGSKGAPAASPEAAAPAGGPPPGRLYDELDSLYPWTTIEGEMRIGADVRFGSHGELAPKTTVGRKLTFRLSPGRVLLVRAAMRAREGKARVRFHFEGETAEKAVALAGPLDEGLEPPLPMREMVDVLLPVPASLHGKRPRLLISTDLGLQIQYIDVREIDANAAWHDIPFPFIVDQAGIDAKWSVRYRVQCLTPDLRTPPDANGCRVVATLPACNVHDRPFMGKHGGEKPEVGTINRPDSTGFVRFDDASRCKDEPAR
ncbi:hypothetical protein [Polyangium aurulentum]|uniref:hypothetical protein n=1 Tax=Polyangium aurulentum TaxID=2567896 RepID=UPI0010ADB895|nr:hypothetical protein [Polyangium aurulentum]UQA58800.1 hypothetical protein E8A73_047525 [Polyangium aurulentum]